jgi:hypothetical protein
VPVRSRHTTPRHPLKSPRFPLCIPARLGRGARAQPPHDATASAEKPIFLLFTICFRFRAFILCVRKKVFCLHQVFFCGNSNIYSVMDCFVYSL